MTHAQTDTSDPTPTNPPACQSFHVSVDQARIRSCAGDNCPIVGSTSRYETICVRGVAEDNPAWVEIDLDPTNDDEAISGYINSSLLVAGSAGTNPNAEAYCDAWTVLPEEAIVRSSPTTSSEIVATFTTGDQICVDSYNYVYRGWSSITQPGGVTGWVNTENLRYVFDESLGCVEDESREIIASSATLYSCAGSSCATNTTLPVGTRVCLNSEQEEDSLWMSFLMPDRGGRAGWMRMDLLQPVDFVEIAAEGTEETQSIFTCTPFRVAGRDAVNVRLEPTTDSERMETLAPDETVCVVGTAGDDNTWYAINLSPQDVSARLGYVSNTLLQPVNPTATPDALALTAEATEAVGESTQDANAVAVEATPTATATVPTASLPPDLGVSRLPLICPLGANPLQPGACVTVTPTTAPVVNTPGNGLLLAKNVPLSSLFFSQSNTLVNTIELTSPETSINFFFRLPDNWIPVDPLVMFLNLSYSENISTFTDITNANLSSQFDVRVDNELVTTVNFNRDDIGDQIVEVPIPARLLNDPARRFHSMELRLSAQDYCRVNTVTRVAINGDTSLINFVYQETLPLLDLAYYPIPFFNRPLRGSDETVWFILPDNPTVAEMQALASISGGLGRLTDGRIITHFSFVSQVTPQLWQGNNLYLIGTPQSNPLIRRLYDLEALSSTLNENGDIVFPNLTVEPDDGVLHLISNPDNPSRAIMVVTGTSDTGIAKAGQALGGPPSLLNLGGPSAVIFDTRAIVRATEALMAESAPALYSFADFQVEDDIVLNGIGPQSFNFDFNVPLGGPLRSDAYMEVVFNASDILDSANASLSVLLNGIPVGSTILSRGGTSGDVSDTQFSSPFRRLRVSLPPSIVVPGQNEVTILVDMQGDWGCDLPDFQSLWTTVSKDSVIFIPQETLPGIGLFPIVGQFPVPFAAYPNLEDLFISMPEVVNNADMETLLALMEYLGGSNPFGEGYRPVIHRGELPSGTDLSLYNFIVLGRPSTNSFLRSINESLPQKFAPDSDEIVQEFDDISYRLIPGLDIGVLQVLSSPFNGEKLMLIMTGTSDAGQLHASNVLLDLAFGRGVLAGNIVYATQNDASPVDTRFVFNPGDVIERFGDLLGPVVASSVASPTPTGVAVMVVTATVDPNSIPTATVAGTLINPTPWITVTVAVTPFSEPEVIVPIDPTTVGDSTSQRPEWVLLIIGVAGVLGIGLGGYAIYNAIQQRNKKDDEL